MAWLFSHARGKRSSAHTALVSEKQKPFDPNFPTNATPRSPPTRSVNSSLRKRRRSQHEDATEHDNETVSSAERGRPQHFRTQSSIENITALPGARRLERSPHLRRSSTYRAAIPYKSSRNVPASRIAAMTDESASKAAANDQKPTPHQQRRLSKRYEHRAKAIREEEIRAMSAPDTIPRQHSTSADMLNRDNKKAKRNFSNRGSDDKRHSNVSLPLQESIHSSMSGSSDQRAWEVPKLNILSPRPTVRVSEPLGHGSPSPSAARRSDAKRGKMPATSEESKKRDRRRVAELADTLDASDLRAAMDRERRRKDKEQLADKERLAAKLKRRAERARAKERAEVPPLPQTTKSVHPAHRHKSPFEDPPSTYGMPPPSPVSDRGGSKPWNQNSEPLLDDHNVKQDPFADVSDSAYTHSLKATASRDLQRWNTYGSTMATPLETPMVDMAIEVRYVQRPLSESLDQPLPPPSPIRDANLRSMSPLRREYTPDLPPLSDSDLVGPSPANQERKSRTWSSIFRRSTGAGALPSPTHTETSFSNTSRDSMSRQPLPAHLVGGNTGQRRRSATPARTTSIFREDLPESSAPSPAAAASPVARIDSPEIMAAAAFAAARRGKRPVDGPELAPTAMDSEHPLERTISGIDNESRDSAAVSGSLASVDSEGSWLAGRPAKRSSHASLMRSSGGSSSRHTHADNPSYENLGVGDEELVRRLTPSPEDEAEVEHANDDDDDDGTEWREPESLLQRVSSQRKPKIVSRNETARSAIGLVDMGDGDAADTDDEDSGSDYDDDDNGGGGKEHDTVVYGQGHARHLSTGSAKLLEIPSRTRSGRNTPSGRLSLASTPDLTNRSPSVSSAPFRS